MRWYFRGMWHYADFRGRSPRVEFIELLGGLFLLIVAAHGIDRSMYGGDGREHTLITRLVLLVHVMPSLAVTVRRLHDIDRSGWFAVISFVPVLSFIVLLLALPRGSPGSNRFGPSPLKAI